MSFLNFLSKRKRFSLASIALLAILLSSGALVDSGAFSSNTVNYTQGQTSITFQSAAPTFVGTVGSNPSGAFLAGPISSSFSSASSSQITDSTNTPSSSFAPITNVPELNPKPGLPQNPKNPSGDPPKMGGCSGCYSISPNSGGAMTNQFALNAVSNFQTFGYTIEPPDQALCANSQYVVELLNIGIMQIYSASTLKPVSGIGSLDSLMALPSQGTGGWSSAGDVSCLYDSGNGGHWFIIEIVSTSPETPGSSGQPGPFQGCFVAAPDSCREGIAVSVTNNPMGAYNVYYLDPNFVNNDPGSASGPVVGAPATLLNDYAKIGTTQNAFMLFYDEFPLYGGFNGAQEFAFSKSALETGASANSINFAYENMGTASNIYPIPSNGAFQPITLTPADCANYGVCWYQVIPAQTPDASQFDNSNGGTGWMVASLDFLGAGDNRVASFDWTGLCALDGSCSSQVMFGGTLYTLPNLVYMNEGAACLVQYGGLCGLGEQQTGPTPLADNCGQFVTGAISLSCPASGIATNGDGATQASYADGQLWTAVSTTLTQTAGRSNQLHLAAAYWSIGSNSVSSAGYVTAANEDIEFPSIAATDGGSALMSFTLSGPDYYPSSAYTWLTQGSNTIYITAKGQSPQDGFSEYQGWPGTTRPRWGDYGAAIFVPSAGPNAYGRGGQDGQGSIFFASEYIQYQSCNDQAFVNGITSPTAFDALTCGGTRTVQANWGSSINSIVVSQGPSGHGQYGGF